MAFLVVHHDWLPISHLFWLIAASCCFYSAGMILNDVFDVATDREQRPDRPIPSNRISLATARNAGFLLLAVGLACCTGAGFLANLNIESVSEMPLLHQPMARAVLIGTLLGISIVLYDGPLKKTVMAPWVMGGCRFFNILLGASTFVPDVGASNVDPVLALPYSIWWIAASIAVLISGVTLLARKEAATEQHRPSLVFASVILVFGLIGIALIYLCPLTHTPDFQKKIASTSINGFLIFIAVVALTVLRHVFTSVVHGTPKTIQVAVVTTLRSLVMIDAAICFLFSFGVLMYPLSVAALMLPAMVLGKFIRST